jgi:hypothetical protein
MMGKATAEPVEVQYEEIKGSDLETGEIRALVVPGTESLEVFRNIAAQAIQPEAIEVLTEPVDEEDIEVLPTGEIYLPHTKYRARLNRAFGQGAWAMAPLDKPRIQDTEVIQPWALYVNGQFMSYTVAGAEMLETNDRMKWSDVLETLKSNAIMRLCKDWGVADVCWDKRWANAWKAKYAVRVWRSGGGKPQWRRLNDEPFWNETGIEADSPNKERYQPPKATVRQGAETTKKQNAPKEKPAATKPTSDVVQEPVAGASAEMVTLWDGKTILPAHQAITGKQVAWFNKHFVDGDDAVWNFKHLENHLRSHFQVDSLFELTVKKFNALVKYTFAQKGDERGAIDPEFYADKLAEAEGAPTDKELEDMKEEPYGEVDAVALVNRWATVLAGFWPDDVLGKAIAYLNEDEKRRVSALLDLVESGKVSPTLESLKEAWEM